MLDGLRMGEVAGAQLARTFPYGIPDWALPIVARWVLAEKRRAGDAHLEPEEGFLTRFPGGYRAEKARLRSEEQARHRLPS